MEIYHSVLKKGERETIRIRLKTGDGAVLFAWSELIFWKYMYELIT